MFSQACVKNSVHGEGGEPPQTDTPTLRQTPPGRHAPGRHLSPGLPPRNGHCSGRYASYWNAFLFTEILSERAETFYLLYMIINRKSLVRGKRDLELNLISGRILVNASSIYIEVGNIKWFTESKRLNFKHHSCIFH